MSDEVEDFLAHYGVKGMRWGHRKSEEQVNSERTARREVRAQKYERKAEMFQTKISELQKTSPNSYMTKSTIMDLEGRKQQALADAESKRQGKLSAQQKKVVIGASVVAGLTAAYLLQNNIQSGEITRLIAKGKERFGDEEFSFKKNPNLADRNMDADEIHRRVVKHVNPDYGGIGTKMNCRRATFAYEMRRRGYDVQATKTTNGNGQNSMGLLNALSPNEKIRSTGKLNVMKTAFNEVTGKEKGKPTPMMDLQENFAAGGRTKIHGGGSPSRIFETLAREPDGSRGELGVIWDIGGGHSMAYEIVKGKPIVFDAQSGKKITDSKAFYDALGPTKSAGFTRLDNVELNHDYLMRWMKDAK